jgi:thiamine biosynthesis protein ThiS
MEIRFNGKTLRLGKTTSLFDFLKNHQGIDPEAGYIAAAVNEKIAKRTEWTTLLLKEGDRIELIQAVQGG